MKNLTRCISCIVVFFAFILLLIPISVSAASASASLSGPGTVRAGDTITVAFSVNSGDGLLGVSGEVKYNTAQLTLSGTAQKIGGNWAVVFNNSAGTVKFVANDATQTTPIKKNTALFEMKFKVGQVNPGDKIGVTTNAVEASAGDLISVSNAAYNATVAAPLATNNTLASLTVANASISPAFSASTTAYTADVPFTVSKLEISAAAEDAKAKVSINNPTLTPNGTTNVTITVTAENGAKKVYTIKVKRAQDPNYKPGSNNKLASITPEGFLLSPKFSPDVTAYVVWLPYETESIRITGTAQDGKGSVEVTGGDKLLAGQDNTVKVVGIAEDGARKEYIVTVKRAAAHDGSVEEVSSTAPESAAASDNKTPANTAPSNGFPLWALILTGILGLAAGFGICFAVKARAK